MNLKIRKIKHIDRNKSDILLYPLLGISLKDSTGKVNCYTEIENIYAKRNYILALEINSNYDTRHITNHKLFIQRIEISNKTYYIFNLRGFSKDISIFHRGKYSELSEKVKMTILKYYKGTYIYNQIESWLYPEKYYNDYSKILDVDINDLKETKELASVPVLEKEIIPYICDNINQ